jgi:ParB family chromosome partitioning protein
MKTHVATGTRDALSKGSFYNYDPEQLILITDPQHPLYDPRALEKPDEALVQSMLKFGFKTSSSIEVESTKEGLVVVDGRRRTVAARECKRRQIAAGEDITIRVRCLMSKDKPFVGMILGNAHRKDENILQKAAKAKRAIDMGQSEKEIADLFGVTTQTIKNWLAADALPISLKKALETEKITLVLALDLAKKSPEELAQALAGAETTPLRGAQGKARVKAPSSDEVSKRLGAAQIRKVRDALLNDEVKGTNVELATALLSFVLGDDPTGKALAAFEPVREIARGATK